MFNACSLPVGGKSCKRIIDGVHAIGTINGEVHYLAIEGGLEGGGIEFQAGIVKDGTKAIQATGERGETGRRLVTSGCLVGSLGLQGDPAAFRRSDGAPIALSLDADRDHVVHGQVAQQGDKRTGGLVVGTGVTVIVGQ